MPVIRTVLGDVPAAELGVCDAHDHLFFRSAQLAGQELDDAHAAVGELRAFAALGGRRWCSGRRSGWGGMELTTGCSDPGASADAVPRAWMIKVAGNFHHLTRTRVTMIAAAGHHATGAPIGVHHELGTAAADVAELLCEQLQVPADKVILGHLNRLPDCYLHRQVAETGAFLAFDGPSRANHATDWRLHECLADLVRHGHEDQILIGGDTTTAAARSSTGGGPGLPYLLRVLRPRLAAELGEDVAAKFFTANPARAFSWA